VIAAAWLDIQDYHMIFEFCSTKAGLWPYILQSTQNYCGQRISVIRLLLL